MRHDPVVGVPQMLDDARNVGLVLFPRIMTDKPGQHINDRQHHDQYAESDMLGACRLRSSRERDWIIEQDGFRSQRASEMAAVRASAIGPTTRHRKAAARTCFAGPP